MHHVVKPTTASLSRGQLNILLENCSKSLKAFQPLSYFFQEADAKEAPRREAAWELREGGRLGNGAIRFATAGLTMGLNLLKLKLLLLGMAGPVKIWE